MNYKEIYNDLVLKTNGFTDTEGYYYVDTKPELQIAIDILKDAYADVERDGLDYLDKDPNGKKYKIKFSTPVLEEQFLYEAYIGDSMKEAMIEKHDQLNPKLWDSNNELKPEVKEKLNEIVNKFEENLKANEVDLDIEDVCIIGSNASYNYNDTSDIDLHIIADTSIYSDEDLALKTYLAYKSLFNDKYDPTVRGIDVEVYVEPHEVHANSRGIYSLNNGWLKEPEAIDIPEVDEAEIDKLSEPYKERAAEANTIEDVDKLIDDIYLQRQQSIQKDGEFGKGNLIFKFLRSLGILQDLKDKKVELENKEMSIEESSMEDKFNENLEKYFIEEDLCEDAIESYPELLPGQLYELAPGHQMAIKDVVDNGSVILGTEIFEDDEYEFIEDYKHIQAMLFEYGAKLVDGPTKETTTNEVNTEDIGEDLTEYPNGLEFKFPDPKDTLQVYLDWEGIYGFTDDIIDFGEMGEDALEGYLEDEGIYGYTHKLYQILNGDSAFCEGMSMEDFEAICRDNFLDYTQAIDDDVFDESLIKEEKDPLISKSVSQLKNMLKNASDEEAKKIKAELNCRGVYLKGKGPKNEDTVKQNGKWVNKGKEGTHGKFNTKKEANAQRKAMFARGYKGESLGEDVSAELHEDLVPDDKLLDEVKNQFKGRKYDEPFEFQIGDNIKVVYKPEADKITMESHDLISGEIISRTIKEVTDKAFKELKGMVGRDIKHYGLGASDGAYEPIDIDQFQHDSYDSGYVHEPEPQDESLNEGVLTPSQFNKFLNKKESKDDSDKLGSMFYKELKRIGKNDDDFGNYLDMYKALDKQGKEKISKLAKELDESLKEGLTSNDLTLEQVKAFPVGTVLGIDTLEDPEDPHFKDRDNYFEYRKHDDGWHVFADDEEYFEGEPSDDYTVFMALTNLNAPKVYSIDVKKSLKEGYNRLSKKFDNVEDARKFAKFLDPDLKPMIDQFDHENDDGSVSNWYEVYYWDPVDYHEDELDESKDCPDEDDEPRILPPDADDDDYLDDRDFPIDHPERSYYESLNEGLSQDAKDALESVFTDVTFDREYYANLDDETVEEYVDSACNFDGHSAEDNILSNYEAAKKYVRKLAKEVFELLDESLDEEKLTFNIGDKFSRPDGKILVIDELRDDGYIGFKIYKDGEVETTADGEGNLIDHHLASDVDTMSDIIKLNHYTKVNEELTEAVNPEDPKAQALALYLDVTTDSIDSNYDDNVYDIGNEEYFVATEDEAYERAKDEIKMSYDDMGLDAFTPDFQEFILDNCIDQDEVDNFVEEEIRYFTEDEPDKNMVDYLEGLTDKVQYIRDTLGSDTFKEWSKDKVDLDKLADEAIERDGKEHFISYYDGNEIDLGDGLYAYRLN